MSGDGRASPTPFRRPPYSGSRRKLVLAFDFGTTFSGVSYCILDPGQVPVIKGVTQFPAQVPLAGGCKIPTTIYYDKEGRARAMGAETLQQSTYEKAEEEKWFKAEWFKLHLRSKFGHSPDASDAIPPLPEGKSVVDVVADFLAYMLHCTEIYIRDTHPYGVEWWETFVEATHRSGRGPEEANDGIHFVLSHPNGWEGKEHARMREAAVKARLVPDNLEGQNRITFISEGEASLHFAVQNGLLSHVRETQGIVVVDAGGGTIDVSTYKRRGERGENAFQEVSEPKCYFHGSVFVTLAARKFIQKLLSDGESPFLEDLDDIVTNFDKTTKLLFRNDQDAQYIKFGGRKDNDADVNIRFGQMKLEGSDVATFFQPSVDCIVQVVVDKIKEVQKISHVVFAGGFSASTWLFERVREILVGHGLTVIRPENNIIKSVSDGAVSFFLDRFVSARVSKATYGVPASRPFCATDPEHRRRIGNRITMANGVDYVQNGFYSLLSKGQQVDEERVVTQGMESLSFSRQDLLRIHSEFTCYRGYDPNPLWTDTDPDNFSRLFGIWAQVPIETLFNTGGRVYYRAKYEVVLMFGLTELKAYIQWSENGVVKKTPAQLIYD